MPKQKHIYRVKDAFYDKKVCGNCLYLAIDDGKNDRNSNCVEEYFRTGEVKENYPVVSKAKDACEKWRYYCEEM